MLDKHDDDCDYWLDQYSWECTCGLTQPKHPQFDEHKTRALLEMPVYTLDELLSGMTEENLYGEVNTGAAVGNEFA